MIGSAMQPTNPLKFYRKIASSLILISPCLQSTYYFSLSKDTTISNGEQSTIYTHFDDNQICLANMLKAPLQTAA